MSDKYTDSYKREKSTYEPPADKQNEYHDKSQDDSYDTSPAAWSITDKLKQTVHDITHELSEQYKEILFVMTLKAERKASICLTTADISCTFLLIQMSRTILTAHMLTGLTSPNLLVIPAK